MVSAAENETSSAFIRTQEASPIRNTFDFLGHSYPRTSVHADNSANIGFSNNTIKKKRSKAIIARFY